MAAVNHVLLGVHWLLELLGAEKAEVSHLDSGSHVGQHAF
jgi:hypothetical protein